MSEPIYQVGWRWEYQHVGPRPGSVEPEAIDGKRIRQVISFLEEPHGKQWVIEEEFTNSPDGTVLLYVNQDRELCALGFKDDKGETVKDDKGETVKMEYLPQVPYQTAKLNIAEKKTFESRIKVSSADFSMPITMIFERLKDETITTPAGVFAGCQHYKVNITSFFDIKIAKIPLSEEREVWYHPEVNGVVKEIYRKSPVKFLFFSKEGYTATSTLMSFGKAAIAAKAKSF